MEKTQTGRCALCGQNRELQLSHIVPHFVGRKLISTSPGSIRSSSEPNRTLQDISKEYMLCADCEELFSAKETWFASHIFNPYIDKKEKLFSYNDKLTYFIISLSWRTLYLDLEKFSTDPSFDKLKLMVLFRAEQTMRDYLLGKRSDLDTIQNHMFFLDRVQAAPSLAASMNPNVVMHRTISSYTVCDGQTLFTLSNLMGILVVTFYSMDSNEIWVNTKIELGNGTFRAENQHMASVVGSEIQYWMDCGAAAQQNLSEKQRKKLEAKLYALGDDFLKYPIAQDLFADFELDEQKTEV